MGKNQGVGYSIELKDRLRQGSRVDYGHRKTAESNAWSWGEVILAE